MFDLSGKTALVTGASGGIGGAIAKTLATAGAKVALAGTRLPALEALAAEIGSDCVVVTGDLSTPEGPAALFAAAESALGGRIDILINNAGLTRDQLSMRMKDEDWQAVIDVNLTAGFKLSRAAMKNMMKARWGRIIAITSVVGATGNPGQANYAAAKAGTTGMTKALAYEVASRGITVNCVAPGFIDTAMTGHFTDDQREAIVSRIPAGRMGTVEEVAAAVLYLASNEAGYVTGATIHLNGGMAMI